LPPAQKTQYGSFKPTREVRAAWEATLALTRVLGSRLVLFQCPASFGPTRAHVRDLTRFFETAERGGLGFVWEPRGEWTDATIKSLCRRLRLIHGVDPFQRRPVWGEPAYFRLHGQGGYHSRYTDPELSELARRTRDFDDAYVLFNNARMWDDARRFRRQVLTSSTVEPENP
ncbi:MAG TPA: DUF72 domain-containing protein, partial [Methylomirabilota bacterium]|nr:DUF72 domain-containing protein [Methylomirabilota bacterium]